MEEQITISKAEYNELVKRELWLTYLEGAGVDNWNGLEFARDQWLEDGHGDEEDEG